MESQGYDFAQIVSCPSITADNDRLVPPDESQALYAKAGEPKKLVVLKHWGHYEVYTGDAFRQVMAPTLAWFREYLAAR